MAFKKPLKGNTSFNFLSARLSDRQFNKLSIFIQSNFGIKMPPAKRTMLEARLQKRLRRLEIKNFDDYCDFLFSNEGMRSELINMINVVTTNKTDFFREPAHFEYLTQKVLPQLNETKGWGFLRCLKVWSAGCSSGEEPYTICIVLNEYAEQKRGFSFSLLATDISTKVLEKAELGIYPEEKVVVIPYTIKKKYLLRSKNKDDKLVRIKPELRRQVKFQRLNLIGERFSISERQDIIFCRNVLIYFDKKTQEELIMKFFNQLNSGGYLFLGHSETLCGMNVPFISEAPTIYRKKNK